MVPTGLAFAAFLAGVVATYWAVPPRRAVQNSVLLIASYLFYASWSLTWLPLLLVSTGIDFAVTRSLDDRARTDGGRQKLFLLSLVVNLSALIWLKYRNFLVGGFADLLGMPEAGSLSYVLPIGISYYTLIKVGYVLDVYHRRVPAERSLLTYATFVAFFPQMLAGPITRAVAMLPQLSVERRPRLETFGKAAGALLLGWWMKAYVADWLAPNVVDPVFGAPDAFGASGHWLALFAYAAQIFCDFAGYSLLAIGVGRLLGLELPQNFDRPFLSRSMPEFWRRWHISLNTWLFDYLYGPWTTGRGILHSRVALNLVIVFTLSGIWHGTAATFVVWGLLHGLALAAHVKWDEWYRSRCRVDRRWVTARRSPAYALAAWGLTSFWFVMTLILFRSETLAQATAFGIGLLGRASGAGVVLDKIGWLNVAVAFSFVVVHHLEGLPLGRRVRAVLDAAPAPILGALAGLAVAWLLVFAPLARGSFIYAQF